jgi:hypothetical protein
MHYGTTHQPGIAMCLLAEAHYHSKRREKDVGPTYGFAASPEVGPGTTVGTLQTGYRRLQASSQDKEGGVQPRAVMYPAAPKSASQLRWAPRLPRVQRLRSPPPWYRGLRRRHVYRGSGTCLPTGRAPGCHASCGPQWPTSLKHEENPSRSTCAVRLAYSQRTHACFQDACR